MAPKYPDTRTENVMDTLAGVSFPDPYRWLEGKTDEVRQWQSAQNALAHAHVHEWPHVDRLRKLIAEFSVDKGESLPQYASGRWFRTHVPDGAKQAQALVSDEPMGEGSVVFDPARDNPDHPPFLSWIAPSPDGRTLAVGVCSDGSEANTIRLIDVATGQPIADPPAETLMDSGSGGVHWLPDSSGFLFVGITGTAVQLEQSVYLHRRTPKPATEIVKVPWTGEKDFRMMTVSRDGKYAVAVEWKGVPVPVAVAPLGRSALEWQPFITQVGGTVVGHLVGERFIAVTDIDAPRGRVVAIPLNAKNPNDTKSWIELVPQSDAVVRSLTPVGDTLYLTEFVDTYSRVRMVDLNGKDLGGIELPGRGAVAEYSLNRSPKAYADSFLFSFSTLAASPGVYSHTPGSNRKGVEELEAPHVRLDNTVVEDRWAASSDGARIPYHTIRRADVKMDRPQPTLIYAYGGFNAPMLPSYPGAMAAFVAAGGVFVHANLRGGGEFGLEWWEAGRLKTKQNCYEDLYAVAEDMIRAGQTTSQLLAVTGASNGGLMSGVAVTQRPDLWKVSVPRVPIVDLIGGCRDPYGRMGINMDYANVDDPDDVRRMATFSPYQSVRDGVRYPAIYLDAGDTDPRCPPWHARKFGARLQAATSGDAPILLRVWDNAGHGAATDKTVALNQNTEWLAFTMRHLGMDLP